MIKRLKSFNVDNGALRFDSYDETSIGQLLGSCIYEVRTSHTPKYATVLHLRMIGIRYRMI